MSEMKSEIRFSLKREWPLLIILLGSLVYGIYVYPTLPDKVPSHWNFNGEVDGWSSPFWGAFGIPLLNIGLYLLFFVMPKIDPNKERYVQFTSAYNAFRYVFHVFMTGVYIIIMMAANNQPVNVGQIVPMGVAVLLIIIGNYMGKVRKNYFFGVKTPWTLASEEVWQKTHRMTGPLWVVSGIVGFIGAFFGGKAGYFLFFGMIVVIAVVPMAYSYFVFRKVQK